MPKAALIQRIVLEDRANDYTSPKQAMSSPRDNASDNEQSPPSSEEDLADYQTQSISEIALQSITEAIDRLYRVSFQLDSPAAEFEAPGNS